LWSLLHSVRSMFASHPGNNAPFIAPPINQARTPAAWLRIQDYRYAQEVLHYVKPTAHSIIARVYDPVVLVLKQSNRIGHALQDESFFSLTWNLFRKHLYPFLLAVIFSVAFVTLLMQYLLWDELPEEEGDGEESKSSIIRVENLPKSHHLDIINIATCSKGHLVSVGLDKLVTFSIFDQRTHHYSLSSALSSAMTPPIWPIPGLTIDDSGHWAALCGESGDVIFWNMLERRATHSVHVELNNERPMLFNLMHLDDGSESSIHLLIGTSHGQISVIDITARNDEPTIIDFGQERLSMLAIARSKSSSDVIALTRSGRLRIATYANDTWEMSSVEKYDPRLAPSSTEGVIKSYSVAGALNVAGAVRLRVVDLIDIKSKMKIHSFPAVLVRGHSLRILHSQVRMCKSCGANAVHSLSLAYTDFESHSATLRTYAHAEDHQDLICLGPRLAGKKYSCRGLSSAKEHLFPIENPGSWESMNTLGIAGVRKTLGGADTPHSTMSTTSGFDAPQFNLDLVNAVKTRGGADTQHHFGSFLSLDHSTSSADREVGEWEVWTMTMNGEFHVEPLHHSSANDISHAISEDDLLAADLGPVVRLGQRSIAIGFGNRVKVVMVGNERFEQDASEFQDLSQQASVRRRKAFAKRSL